MDENPIITTQSSSLILCKKGFSASLFAYSHREVNHLGVSQASIPVEAEIDAIYIPIFY